MDPFAVVVFEQIESTDLMFAQISFLASHGNPCTRGMAKFCCWSQSRR
jgi:hypothetical protein